MNMQRFESSLLGEHYILAHHSSGLPIYIFPKKAVTAFALLGVSFGSADRADGQGGVLPEGTAHFLEHKLFENADGSDSFERFSALGADANAYTSATRTVYHFATADHFDEALAELLDFVMHPSFREASVARERGIIGEELRQCLDDPGDRAYYGMLAGLFAKHPVRDMVCGTEASIQEITPEVLYRAYRTYYRPSNMALVVCGDVEPEQILSIAERHLPVAVSLPAPSRVTVPEPREAVRPLTRTRGQVAIPAFCIGIKDVEIPRDPWERARRDAAMSVLSDMLFSSSGELYHRLLEAGLIGVDLFADYTVTGTFAFLQIEGESKDPEAMQRALLAYLDEKRRTGLSEKDFERCRRVQYAEYVKSFDSTEEIAETLLSFVQEGVEPFSFAEIIRSLRLSDVEALLEHCFDPSYFTLSVVDPDPE